MAVERENTTVTETTFTVDDTALRALAQLARGQAEGTSTEGRDLLALCAPALLEELLARRAAMRAITAVNEGISTSFNVVRLGSAGAEEEAAR